MGILLENLVIENYSAFEEWENNWIKTHPADYLENLRIYEALYEEAAYLRILPSENPLEHLEEKIAFARRLNVSRNS